MGIVWRTSGGHLEVARWLVLHGADVTAQDENGSTPLHQASKMRSVEPALLFIELSTDVAAQDKHGSTPLHQASLSGIVELTRLLVEHGADVKA
jgi:ankyrin repeat protein